jgi:DNA mismatch endonuclease (patch repair protein)
MESALRRRLNNGGFRFVPAGRRRLMARIGPGAKSTEQVFRMLLVRSRIRGWRINRLVESTRPDFYFAEEGVALFVDGCFWHGCDRCGHVPRTRRPFWREKLLRNRKRDRRDTGRLKRKGIKVVRVWEHDLKSADKAIRALGRLQQALQRGDGRKTR